ncbi:MAG TPA: pilus assembly protein PilP [Polyangiaceae bacterium]|jgi:type IV pilus assembly protein PilP|nr:pilus assembly protein PilP [Polyangiaceae bacterium]
MTGRALSTGLVCCALPLLLAACEDKVLTASTVPQAAATTAAPKASASAERAPSPRVPIDEADFTESERSRDPFRSYARVFAQENKGRVHSQREVVLPEYTLDELKLIGIVTRMQPAKAMLVDPNGKGHVIQRGQFVGRADVVQGGGRTGTTYEVNWRVDRIRDGDVVLVREDPTNPDVPTITRVIPLRTQTVQEGIEK